MGTNGGRGRDPRGRVAPGSVTCVPATESTPRNAVGDESTVHRVPPSRCAVIRQDWFALGQGPAIHETRTSACPSQHRDHLCPPPWRLGEVGCRGKQRSQFRVAPHGPAVPRGGTFAPGAIGPLSGGVRSDCGAGGSHARQTESPPLCGRLPQESAARRDGKVTVNTVPRPSCDFTAMWPPCACTSRSATANPKPVPPVCRLRLVSAR